MVSKEIFFVVFFFFFFFFCILVFMETMKMSSGLIYMTYRRLLKKHLYSSESRLYKIVHFGDGFWTFILNFCTCIDVLVYYFYK